MLSCLILLLTAGYVVPVSILEFIMEKYNRMKHSIRFPCFSVLRLLTGITFVNLLSISCLEAIQSSSIFQSTCQNYRMINFIIDIRKAENILQCIHRCKRNVNCKSINFKNLSEQDMNNYSLNCELLNGTLKSGGNKELVGKREHHEPINLVSINYYLDFNLKTKHFENIVPLKRFA